jgi:ABC-type multidrug transport system fused ATPase/permease subunit
MSADASMLADRLGRYVESDVTLSGTRLRALPLDDVRAHILVVPNNDRLFAGPLRVELDPHGSRIDDATIERAIDAASARDIVDALPAGLESRIEPAGRNFSGGEQQRLRLVRALMIDPPVLVLVEPTSAVDAHTELRIARRLAHERAGRTTVVFTRSPIVLQQADQVVYVENATAVTCGRHAELLADPRYRGLIAREIDPA